MFSKAEGPTERDTQSGVGVRKQKVSTPVRTKVQRFEDISKDLEIGKTLRKVKKVRDRPGEGVQASIKKFLQKVEKMEGPSIPNKDGASTKPSLASLRLALSTTSSPKQGPLPKGGGKKGKGRVRDGRGSVRTLEKWLLPLGSPTGYPDLEDIDGESEDKTSLEDQGGG